MIKLNLKKHKFSFSKNQTPNKGKFSLETIFNAQQKAMNKNDDIKDSMYSQPPHRMK